MHHAGAADAFEDLLKLLALAEAVHEGGAEDADVGAEGAVEEHVAGDAIELAEDDADELGALGGGDAHELLGGEAEDELVVEVRHVVEAVEERDDLPVVLALAELLGAPVEVADDGLSVDDALALDGEDHAEDAVGAGVLRPHVEQHVDAFEAVGAFVVDGARRDRCAGAVGGHRGRSSRASSSSGVSQVRRRFLVPLGGLLEGVVLPEGVLALELVEQEEEAGVGVAGEGDAEELGALALVPVGAAPDGGHGRDGGIVMGALVFRTKP